MPVLLDWNSTKRTWSWIKQRLASTRRRSTPRRGRDLDAPLRDVDDACARPRAKADWEHKARQPGDTQSRQTPSTKSKGARSEVEGSVSRPGSPKVRIRSLSAEGHSIYCGCGLKLSPPVWRAGIPYGVDRETALAWYKPTDDQLLDCSLPLQEHDWRLDWVFSTFILQLLTNSLAKPFPMALCGRRRLNGRLLLLRSSNFVDIAHTPGCFYVENFDWKDNLPHGFFDLAFDHKRFPDLGVDNRGLLPPMLVFSVDFAGLTMAEATTDAELRAECERVMWAAAAAFYDKYVPLLGADPLLFSRRKANGSPYGFVRTR
ncbi:hypothetical protein AURDEDRAFT_120808 [Auricularia subglabra TFB-10046 SS5]|nr:hypothetical protein AURDEDRAFT_120808 [Auricularia subglabra TFB-10046 SS5]